MTRRSLITLISLLFIYNITFANNTLRLSLITCSGGSELYSTFGHSALRVVDSSRNQDIVFNFGLFDFNTPNFYLKFTQGKLNYMLGVQYTQDFIEAYKLDRRAVYEQILDLTEEEEILIVDRLMYLYQPQFRNYLYSFLFKNCTTELRDMLYDKLKIDKASLEKMTGTTHRELINVYVGNMKWTKVGINLLLGSSLDRDVTIYETMFLPDNLMDELGKAENNRGKIVKETIVLNDVKRDSKEGRTLFLLSPIFVFSLLLLLVLASFFIDRLAFVDKLLLGILSLFGVVLPFIVIITDHVELLGNYNLFWCNPVYLIILISLLFKWRKMCIGFTCLAATGIIITAYIWISGIQAFEFSFILIVVAIILVLSRTLYKCRIQESVQAKKRTT
ncbi:MAG: hypothetical protein ACD_77C00296G0002 [uncultured bacterium]|nr:MAG: hypothetical protein ACD_77C00296G0002 [uncultured bacterium]HBY01563.1 hypothetical protein [Rikenellaceae bacterium]